MTELLVSKQQQSVHSFPFYPIGKAEVLGGLT